MKVLPGGGAGVCGGGGVTGGGGVGGVITPVLPSIQDLR